MTQPLTRIDTKRALLALLASAGLVLSLSLTTARADQPEDLHCPEKDHPEKVESAEAFGDLVFEKDTMFCAKKKTGHTGVIVADGITTLYEYLVAAGIAGEEGEGPSYYIVYGMDEQEEEEEQEQEEEQEEEEEQEQEEEQEEEEEQEQEEEQQVEGTTGTPATGVTVPDTTTSSANATPFALAFASLLMAALVILGRGNLAAVRRRR